MTTQTKELNKTIQMLPVDSLLPHPQNPRKELGDLQELTESIRENGILQNLTVVPANAFEITERYYTVVIGHRRLASAKLAGLSHVPCVVADMNPEEQIKTMLMENMQRSDLTLLEQADGFQTMLDLGMTRSEIAKESGFSETTIRRRLNLRKLDRQLLEQQLTQGATLMDLVKLEQIEDEEEKNNVLKHIDTSNFEWYLNQAIQKQQSQENLPKWLELIEKFAVEINDDETHWRYERAILIKNEPNIEELPEDREILFYGYNVSPDRIYLYYMDDNTETEEDSKITEKIADVEMIKAKLKDKAETAYNLRESFIKNHHLTQKQIPLVINMLLTGLCVEQIYFSNRDLGYLIGVAKNLKYQEEVDERKEAFKKLMEKDENKALLYAAYISSGDSLSQSYDLTVWDKLTYPTYSQNMQLDRIYDFLETLGYQISDEEMLLMSGKHPLFEPGIEQQAENADEEGGA